MIDKNASQTVQIGMLLPTDNPKYIPTSSGHFLRRKGVVEALALLNCYLAESLGDPFDFQVVRAGVERFVKTPSLGQCVVAWGENDQILGQLEIKPIFEVWENAAYWYIDNYVVFPEFQNRGIGKQMLEFVREKSAAERISRVRLYVSHTNPRAREFYARHGFSAVGDFMELAGRGHQAHGQASALAAPALTRDAA